MSGHPGGLGAEPPMEKGGRGGLSVQDVHTYYGDSYVLLHELAV